MLADRIRSELRGRGDVVERSELGRTAFRVAGRMACGVIHEDLKVKLGAEGYEAAFAEPCTRLMDVTGKPMRGYCLCRSRRPVATVRLYRDQSGRHVEARQIALLLDCAPNGQTRPSS